MHYWLFITPFIGALLGWTINGLLIKFLFHPAEPKNLFGFSLQGLVPKNQSQFAVQAGRYVGNNLFSFDEIKNKLTNAENIEKLMPFVEEEIDNFLRKKLTEQMPMISMFIGEKTIVQLKSIFVEEIKILFPALISNYINNIEADLNIEAMVAEKIQSVSPATIENFIHQSLKKELQFFKLAGAAAGFIIGLIQLAFVLFL